jgi:hypothetical protein
MLMIGMALPAAAADLTGKWTGKVEFKTPEEATDTAWAEVKQNGTEITGVAGRNETQQGPIEKARLVGNKLTFQLSLPFDPGPRVFRFNLIAVDANHIEGDIEEVGGEKLAGKIFLSRKAS